MVRSRGVQRLCRYLRSPARGRESYAMTQEEADKLSGIFETIDGGCAGCVEEICEIASTEGFGFIWRLTSAYPAKVVAYRDVAVTAYPLESSEN